MKSAPKSKCWHLNQGSTFFRVVRHFPYAGLQCSTSSDFGAMDGIFFSGWCFWLYNRTIGTFIGFTLSFYYNIQNLNAKNWKYQEKTPLLVQHLVLYSTSGANQHDHDIQLLASRCLGYFWAANQSLAANLTIAVKNWKGKSVSNFR